MTTFPFSSIDNFPNYGFLGDTRTGPIVCLSFFSNAVRGDFGTFVATAASLASSWSIWGSTASLAISSVNHTLGLVAVIVSTWDLFSRVLKGGKSARCSMLCNCSNLKQPSVVSWLALGVL